MRSYPHIFKNVHLKNFEEHICCNYGNSDPSPGNINRAQKDTYKFACGYFLYYNNGTMPRKRTKAGQTPATSRPVGRPKSSTSKGTSLYLSIELRNKIEEMTRQTGLKRSKIVEKALEDYFGL